MTGTPKKRQPRRRTARAPPPPPGPAGSRRPAAEPPPQLGREGVGGPEAVVRRDRQALQTDRLKSGGISVDGGTRDDLAGPGEGQDFELTRRPCTGGTRRATRTGSPEGINVGRGPTAAIRPAACSGAM